MQPSISPIPPRLRHLTTITSYLHFRDLYIFVFGLRSSPLTLLSHVYLHSLSVCLSSIVLSVLGYSFLAPLFLSSIDHHLSLSLPLFFAFSRFAALCISCNRILLKRFSDYLKTTTPGARNRRSGRLMIRCPKRVDVLGDKLSCICVKWRRWY